MGNLWCGVYLIPHLVNIGRLAGEQTYDALQGWLDKCHSLGQLDFSPNYMIKHNVNFTKRDGYLQIGMEKLR